MSLTTLIAAARKAVADDAANARAVFAAQGTLVGVTEVDVRTGAHTVKVDEPPEGRPGEPYSERLVRPPCQRWPAPGPGGLARYVG